MLLLSLLSHLLEAACLERTGCECVCESVCVSVCVCVCVRARAHAHSEGAARKCSGLVLGSAVPTGIRKGHMQNHAPRGL